VSTLYANWTLLWGRLTHDVDCAAKRDVMHCANSGAPLAAVTRGSKDQAPEEGREDERETICRIGRRGKGVEKI